MKRRARRRYFRKEIRNAEGWHELRLRGGVRRDQADDRVMYALEVQAIERAMVWASQC